VCVCTCSAAIKFGRFVSVPFIKRAYINVACTAIIIYLFCENGSRGFDENGREIVPLNGTIRSGRLVNRYANDKPSGNCSKVRFRELIKKKRILFYAFENKPCYDIALFVLCGVERNDVRNSDHIRTYVCVTNVYYSLRNYSNY